MAYSGAQAKAAKQQRTAMQKLVIATVVGITVGYIVGTIVMETADAVSTMPPSE